MEHREISKMFGTAIFSLFFVILIVITYSSFVGTVDFRSRFFPPIQSTANTTNTTNTTTTCITTSNATSSEIKGPRGASCSAPLRVYMYDLPRRFHVGMLGDSGPDGLTMTSENLPLWPSGRIMRQHSVAYWLMASLLYDGAGEESQSECREAVRVSDPDTAQAFFVPFFSSLSYDTHSRHPRSDSQLQVEVVDLLRNSKYWQRSGGRDHVIPMTHPNAFRFQRQKLNASVLIVADFARYPRSMSSLNKDVVSPYVHVVESFNGDDPPDPFEARKTLLFFRGGTVRKSGGKVRAKLAKLLTGYGDVYYERGAPTSASIKKSTEGMRSSKFCLHPAGDTPSSCRLFDAIVSHCVPVIVSDQIELPFENEIDYTQFSIFFSVKEAVKRGYLVNELRQIPKERWTEMWRRLKNISHHYEFQYPPKKEDAVSMLWRQVRTKLPGVQLAVHRRRRLKIPDWWRI